MKYARHLLVSICCILQLHTLQSQEFSKSDNLEPWIFGIERIGSASIFVERKIFNNFSANAEFIQFKNSHDSAGTLSKAFSIHARIGIRYYYSMTRRVKKGYRHYSNAGEYFSFTIIRQFDKIIGKRFDSGQLSDYIDYYYPSFGLNRNLSHIFRKAKNKHLQRVNFNFELGLRWPIVYNPTQPMRRIDTFQIPYTQLRLQLLLNPIREWNP